MYQPKGQKKVFMEAEKQMTYDENNAIDLFKSAMAMNISGEYSVSAAYAIGYYYDQQAVVDSALKYYTWIKENHPRSEQSIQANSRMMSINLALSTIEADTTESVIQD